MEEGSREPGAGGAARGALSGSPLPLPLRSGRSPRPLDGGVQLSPAIRLPLPGPAQVPSRGATFSPDRPTAVGGGWTGLLKEAPRDLGCSGGQGWGHRVSAPHPVPFWNRKGRVRGPSPSCPALRGRAQWAAVPGAVGFGKTRILSILRAAARQPGALARVCVCGWRLPGLGLGEAGDAAGWCWSSGSVPPPRTVICSGSLTRPSIFHACKNLALSPPAPLPGMPSLSPGPCIPAVSEPLAAAADAGGAIVLLRTGRRKDECDAGGGALRSCGPRASGGWGRIRQSPPGAYQRPLFSCLARPFPPRRDTTS